MVSGSPDESYFFISFFPESFLTVSVLDLSSRGAFKAHLKVDHGAVL